ncbi:MAG: hypothetical protein IJX80_03145 [Clostridia bacterium]|nr:hypothetical protein [Clostridia bacterium]
MLKRIFALLLCALMLIPALSACATVGEDEDPGAYITMYLTDEIYDFDPVNAYYNSQTRDIVGLLFDTLFKINENGDVEKCLVKEYKINEDEHSMELTLNDTYWSNEQPVTAEDVIFAWKRLLNANNSYEAASLLFDIKNARAVKQGDESIDDLGIEALETKVVKITFEGPIDYNQFILNLTSLATAPLPESHVAKDADWAKKSATIITSGPYKLGKTNYVKTENTVKDDYALDAAGNQVSVTEADYPEKVLASFILERNRYYYRDDERDSIKSSVTNYRILVDCTKSDEDILQDYKDGKIFYVGDIPVSLRNADNKSYLDENVTNKNALSTFVLSLNQNQEINGTKLFAIKEVRQALSLVIDRQAIADAIVYADAATGLVPYGVMHTNASNSASTFREAVDYPIKNAGADKAAAEKLLKDANINASDYSFTIKVAANDETNIAITEAVKTAWCSLDFDVTVEKISTIENNDILKLTGLVSTDICDDLFVESIQRVKYDVIAYDYNAFSADPYSVLANFAKPFAGMAIDMDSNDFALKAHRTGYDSTEYNDLIEAVYYVPYFASLDRETSSDFLGIYETKEEFQAVYDAVKAVYDKCGITATTDSSKWTTQKATLLEAAEAQLMEDMPIIPVVYNRSAVLISDQLTNVASDYYIPSVFTKTDLKDFESYTYTDKKGEKVSIFASFPDIAWDKKGTTEETEAVSTEETK